MVASSINSSIAIWTISIYGVSTFSEGHKKSSSTLTTNFSVTSLATGKSIALTTTSVIITYHIRLAQSTNSLTLALYARGDRTISTQISVFIVISTIIA